VFSREGGGNKHANTDVNDVINQTLVLLDGVLDENGIELSLELEQALPRISSDAIQIQQVLTNLLINSSYELERLTDSADKKIAIRTYLDNKHVCIQIEDTGAGIPKANLKKVFDPFFTTKPQGEGTGLGLSISYGIIKKHKGELTVTSGAGKGCCFTISLPASTSE
jgi:signal transduction histidine kinase